MVPARFGPQLREVAIGGACVVISPLWSIEAALNPLSTRRASENLLDIDTIRSIVVRSTHNG